MRVSTENTKQKSSPIFSPLTVSLTFMKKLHLVDLHLVFISHTIILDYYQNYTVKVILILTTKQNAFKNNY